MQQYQAIADDLEVHRNYERVAAKHGISQLAAINVDIAINNRFVISEDGRGRPELRKYIVATKRVRAPWPNLPEIVQAQKEYDRGEVELATGRDGHFSILYKFPRKVTVRRPAYFGRSFFRDN